MLIRQGIQSHVFVDHGNARTYEQLRHVQPRLLVSLTEGLSEADLPDTVELCVTFRQSQSFSSYAQLDFYFIDEFGFLGHSTDLEVYLMNNDAYYFEQSQHTRLIVTSLFDRVRPMLRIQTADELSPLDGHLTRIVRLSDA